MGNKLVSSRRRLLNWIVVFFFEREIILMVTDILVFVKLG